MNPKDKIHSSWKPIVEILDKDKNLIELNTKILPNITFYPESMDIFNVFQMPVEDIKVVILGQDPYPQKGQAIGYAFAVPEEVPMPKSLQIIAREIENEGLKSGFYDSDIPHWRTLESWREQGVFLLNTALTVEKEKAGSHLKYWKDFTIKLVQFIAQNNPCIWVLWGRKAQEFGRYIRGPLIRVKSNCSVVFEKGDNPNYTLVAPHPAAEEYTRHNVGFYGCNHFNRINEILKKQNKEIINW